MKRLILPALFPSRCIGCRRIVGLKDTVCGECARRMPYIKGRICTGCAMPIDRCECKTARRYFDGLCAPLFYRSTARELVLKIKYHADRRACEFACEKMMRSLFTAFPNERFDVITFVPMDKREQNRRGENQSGVLARQLSKKTLIDCRELLTQVKSKVPQHTLPAPRRRENVAGIYEAIGRLSNETVLLVDDICTTGATLNECAAVLKKSGAKRVFCCVAARSVPEEDNKNE